MQGKFCLSVIPGSVFALISLIALTVIVAKVIALSSVIVEKFNNSVLDSTGGGVMGILSSSMVEVNMGIMNTAFVIYLAVWFLSKCISQN